VIGVLTGHPRRDDVRARLVKLDGRNVALARQSAQAAGLHGVEVLQADAGITDACVGAVPAQIVVACGIFGNITDSDIQGHSGRIAQPVRTRCAGPLDQAPQSPDLTPAIRTWFGKASFLEEAFDTSHDGFMSVGAHRLGRAHRAGAGPATVHLPARNLARLQLDHVVACQGRCAHDHQA
jgi:hypothetical protein